MNKKILIFSLLLIAAVFGGTFQSKFYQENMIVSAAGLDDFVTTWKTDNPGTSLDTQVTIPTTGGGYNYDVDWGDGNSDANVNGNITHTYAVAGTYTIRISGDFPRIYTNNGGDKDKLLTVDQWGTQVWTSMDKAFSGASNMDIVAVDNPDLSSVTSMRQMFADATSMNGDISGWDVSNVTDMILMFDTATSFNQPIGAWTTTSLTDMNNMFQGASSFNQDLTNWNVSGVSNMTQVFVSALAFDGDLSGWDVSGVDTMRSMFFNAREFNGDITGWTTDSLEDMSLMFYNAYKFNQDISGWNVSNVDDMSSTFRNAVVFNQPIGTWTTTSLETLTRCFDNARKFNQDLTNWNVSGVSNFSRAFAGALEFNGDITGWNTSLASDMSLMFFNAPVFNRDISGWDVSGVSDMTSMFDSAIAFNQPIGGWTTTNLSEVLNIFDGASAFNQSLNNWDVSNILDMSQMFQAAVSFNGDISEWEVGHVNNMHSMFLNANAFNQDISGWDVSGLVTATSMFNSADIFNVDLSGWNVVSLLNASSMLDGTSFSTKNYDVLLLEWDELVLQNGVTFGLNGSSYCHGETSKTNIINDYGWTFADNGLDCALANQTPTDVLVADETGFEFEENSLDEATLGLITVVDADDEDTHTIALSCSTAGADDGNFEIDDEGNLVALNSYDFENPEDENEDNIYEICIRVEDDGKPNLVAELPFLIEITNVNNPPSDILVGGKTVLSMNERQDAGTGLGELSSVDDGEDNPTEYEYSFACDDSGDSSFFVIEEDVVKLGSKLYFSVPQDDDQDNTYDLCVRVTETNGGLSADQEILVTIRSIGTQAGSSSSKEDSESSPFEEESDDNLSEPSNAEETGLDENESDLEGEAEEESPDEGELDSDSEDNVENPYKNFYNSKDENQESDETEVSIPVPASSGGGGGGSSSKFTELTPVELSRGEFLQMLMDDYMEDNNLELPEDGFNPYSDIEKGDRYFGYSVLATDLGVLKGYDSSEAKLEKQIMRAEAMAFVTRLLQLDGLKFESSETEFTDIPSGKWYSEIVNKGSQLDLFETTGDTFDPFRSVGKEEGLGVIEKANSLF